MNYSQKTFEELFEPVLEDCAEHGFISRAEDFEDIISNREDISNYYVMDKSVIVYLLSSVVYPDMTRVYESAKIEYAEGSDLDDIGVNLGLPRPQATYAEVDVVFTLGNILEDDVDINVGVLVSSDSGIEYRTLENIFIPAGERSKTVSCRAVVPGIASKVTENTLINFSIENDLDISCTNPAPSTGGEEAYTDDEYRYLLLNWKEINLKGSDKAFENYFARVDGIDSYKLVPNWNGTGTLKVVVDPGTSYQLQEIYDDLQHLISQETEDITMFAPTAKYIDIQAIVNVDIDMINPYSLIEKDDIKARILSSIKTFIDGGYLTDGSWYPGLLLGEDFIPHKLSVFLDSEIPELKNITFDYPNDYIQIRDEEIGTSNNINIEMI